MFSDAIVFPSPKSNGFSRHKLVSLLHISIIILIGISLSLFSTKAHAVQVKVTLDPSPDTTVIGHKLYYCDSIDCSSANMSKTKFSEKIDLETQTVYLTPNLMEETTYYFAATAYDKYGNESVLSEVLSYIVPKKVIVSDENGVSSVLLLTSFDSNSDGFSYTDDMFLNTKQPSYASARYLTSGGYNGGGLQVTLGGVDNTTQLGMSGGWSKSFNLPIDSMISISLRYKMEHIADPDECGEVLVAVDGILLGKNVERLCGIGTSKPALSTNWKKVDFEMALPKGTHTITAGGYLNKKTYHNEFTNIYFDDILINSID
jgi:hypothetical protein